MARSHGWWPVYDRRATDLLTGVPLNSIPVKIQQLRFLAAVAQNDLNITTAAAKLCTTQPAVSKQLELLEDELGFNIFVRRGRTLTRITPPASRSSGIP